MHRLATLLALCALGAAVLAIPASAASEKSQVVKYAKRKVSKDANRQFGIKIPVSDFTAACAKKSGYWKCSVDGNGGQCSGTLRVYGSKGKYSAPKKYYKVGCVADKVIAADIRPVKSIEKYARQVFKRKVNSDTIKLKNPIEATCKTLTKYTRCKVSAFWAEGLCEGTMHVRLVDGKLHATNIKFGCSR